MKIHFIGARGYPASYASAEDMVRELGPRFVRDGQKFTVHGWATEESKSSKKKSDIYKGINRVFHTTPGGKISGQLLVAFKASIKTALSDCDIVHYQCLNSAIFSWIPRIMGKKVVINVNGQIWKDPKWPWGIRHLYFHFSAFLSLLSANKVITDSYHMSQHYKRIFNVTLPFIGYGCNPTIVQRKELLDLLDRENEYYFIMSRITPHNLTDVLVDGFVRSGTRSNLVIAGHLPDTAWFRNLRQRTEGKRVKFLGLVKDQEVLDQLILHCRAYLHGHSLGGINSALVRVVGMEKPVIGVDTPFNREVVEEPNGELQAILFQKNAESVADAIRNFEENEEKYIDQGRKLGVRVRQLMSWDAIYDRYRQLYATCLGH